MRMRTASAFTLIELVIAAALGAILVGGMVSAVVISSKAAPSSSAPATASDARAKAGDALSRLALELAPARAVTDLQERSITFKVADRDGDGMDESITYAWDGIPGHALTRTYNAGSPATVLGSIQSFSLAGNFRDESTTSLGDPVDSSEFLLWASNSGTTRTDQITKNKADAQVFVPSLPSDAISFTVSRIRVHLRGLGSTFKVQLRRATGTAPAAAALAETTITDAILGGLVGQLLGSLLSSAQWTGIALPDSSALPPNAPYALVILCDTGNKAADITIGTTKAVAPGAALLTSSDTGATWSLSPDERLFLEVYGTVRRPTTVTSTTRRLTSVAAALNASANSAGESRLTMRVSAEPAWATSAGTTNPPADWSSGLIPAGGTTASVAMSGASVSGGVSSGKSGK